MLHVAISAFSHTTLCVSVSWHWINCCTRAVSRMRARRSQVRKCARAFFYKSSHCFGARETFIPPPWTTNSSCMITYYFDSSGGAREPAITYWLLSSAFDNKKWSNYARAWESESPGSSLFASRISRTKRRQWVRFARAHFCGGNVVNFNVNFLSKYCLIFPTALAS